MSDTKKIPVYVGDMSLSRFTVAHQVHGELQPLKSKMATLVIHPGPREEVLTKSEHEERVRAMLRDIIAAQHKLDAIHLVDSGVDFHVIANRHGFTL